jgi:hypothetical protein
MKAPSSTRIWVILIAGMLTVYGCGPQSSETQPVSSTASLESRVTEVFLTVEARPNATVTLTPAATRRLDPTPRPQTTATHGLTVEPSLLAPRASPITTQICDRAAAGVPIDVTIPDDSAMDPGENFTKVWRLQNVGACTWTIEYSVQFFSGERMDAPENVPLL